MPNNRYSDNGFTYRPVNQRTPAQVNADQEIARQNAANRARFEAAQQENERIRAQATADRLEAERPMRESQQRFAAEQQRAAEQRSAEYREGLEAIKQRYNAQNAEQSETLQSLRKDLQEDYVRRNAPKLDLAPGSPPGTNDYGSSTRLRNSSLPSPSPLPISPTRGGELVHVPKASVKNLPPPRRFSPTEAGITGLADLLIGNALRNHGIRLDSTGNKQLDRQIDEANAKFWDQVNQNNRNILDGIRNTAKNPGDALKNLLDNLLDPFKKHPRTDPKNDDLRPQRKRYAYELRAFTFYSPNNKVTVQAVSAGGEYSLGQIGYNNSNFTYSPGNTEKLHQEIRWDSVSGDAATGFRVVKASAQCEPNTIAPDPSYIPPSLDLPVLAQPDGTTPDISGYPPIFTEDDFKPARDANNKQAEQAQSDRQSQPNADQQRQQKNEQDNQSAPDPWQNQKPFPNTSTPPYPFPLNPPTPDTPTNATPEQRQRETTDQQKKAANQASPAPNNLPGTYVTINGDRVGTPRKPVPTPAPIDAPGTFTSINGVPIPLIPPPSRSPLPDTRAISPTTPQPPVQSRIDPTTGTTPEKPPTSPPTPPTGEKCKNPCLARIESRQDSLLDKLNAVSNGIDLGLLTTINNKLGAQLPGGIAGKLTRLSEWLHLDRVLNLLNYATTLHNAYMLSNGLTQTLFSMVSNVLAAVGIKDAQGSPLDINSIVGKQVDEFAKTVLGVSTVDGIKAEWKKYNRIYQAASNLLWSFQSIGQSILAALEVVGSMVAKIGNAMRRFGVVSEIAYGWMNPTPNYQNRFFTTLESAENVVSNIDQVASETLSIQDTITQIGTQKTELENSLKQTEGSKQGKESPEAATVKTTQESNKTTSTPPPIPVTAESKPEA